MTNYVMQDPAVRDRDAFRVIFDNRLCSPTFNSRGAAAAYLAVLEDGRREPEYDITADSPSEGNTR